MYINSGEDDIEDIIKSIEAEEKKRTEVTIKNIDAPLQRSVYQFWTYCPCH